MHKESCCSVKICGITSIHDAQLAADAGADYIGVLVDVAVSERTRSATQAAEIASGSPIPTVILLYNRSTSDIQKIVSQVQPFAVQLLGQESAQQVEELKRDGTCEFWKSVYLPAGSPKNVDISAVQEEMQAYWDAGADFLLFDSVDMSLEKPRYGGTEKPVIGMSLLDSLRRVRCQFSSQVGFVQRTSKPLLRQFGHTALTSVLALRHQRVSKIRINWNS